MRKIFKRLLSLTLVCGFVLTSTPNTVKADTYDVEWDEVYADYKNGYIDKANTFYNPEYSVTIGKYRYTGYDETDMTKDETYWDVQRDKVKYHKGARYKVTVGDHSILKAYFKNGYIYYEGIKTGKTTIYLKRLVNGKYKTVDKIEKKVQGTYVKLPKADDYDIVNQNYSLGENDLNIKIVNPKYNYDYKIYINKDGIDIDYKKDEDGYLNFKLNAKEIGEYTIALKEFSNNSKEKALKKWNINIKKPEIVKNLTMHMGGNTKQFVKFMNTKEYNADLELVNGITTYSNDIGSGDAIGSYIYYHPSAKNKQILGIENNVNVGFNKTGKCKVKVYIYPYDPTDEYNTGDKSKRVYLGTTNVTIVE